MFWAEVILGLYALAAVVVFAACYLSVAVGRR